MHQSHRRQRFLFVFAPLCLVLAAAHSPAQNGTSSVSKQQSTPEILPNTRQPRQTSQPNQQAQPQAPSTGGSMPAGLNQMLPGGGIAGGQQGFNPLLGGAGITGAQPGSLADLLVQQQLQQAFYAGIQQMQVSAQAQAAQQQRAAQIAASQQQSSMATRRKERKAEPQDPDTLFAKPNIKIMEEESAEKTSARQLRLTMDIKADAERADLHGDRVEATKLRAKVGQRLTDIVDKYKGTPASKEAAKLLEDMYPR